MQTIPDALTPARLRLATYQELRQREAERKRALRHPSARDGSSGEGDSKDSLLTAEPVSSLERSSEVLVQLGGHEVQEKNADAVSLGQLGGKIGGPARAAK